MTKLKLCPYCGGTAKVKTTVIKFINDNINKYYVECSDCGAGTDQQDTYFPCSVYGGKFHVMTKREAIKTAADEWNEQIFNLHTRLSHMSYREKIIWQINSLLSDAWYGAMVPMDSPEWKTGWELRKTAERKKLLELHSDKSYDLKEVSKILFNDMHVKNVIFAYLEETNNMNFDVDGIRQWNFYFNRFIDGGEYIKPSIKNRICEMLDGIGMKR